MRKIISVLLCISLVACVFAGCAAGNEKKEENGKISIVCTIFPIYDWVNNILGDKKDSADVTMLLDSGADLHSYQPTADDMIKVSTCDVFIYVGGESDEWAEKAVSNATNKDMKAVNLLDALGDNVKEEELVEGMQGEEEEEDGEDEEGPEYDEHIWLSLKNAEKAVGVISDAISAVDAADAETYSTNAKAYQEKLSALDAEYQTAVDGAKTKTLLFGDRFPFRYLTEDYGIEYYAAFVGCSAETEASFETITFLANKVDELGLGYVMTIEGSDGKIAETIIENTKSKNQQVLTLNSMQSTTAADVKNGAEYLKIMTDNLEVLKTALR